MTVTLPQKDLWGKLEESKMPIPERLHRMHILRFRLAYFVNSLHNYIMTRVSFYRLVICLLCSLFLVYDFAACGCFELICTSRVCVCVRVKEASGREGERVLDVVEHISPHLLSPMHERQGKREKKYLKKYKTK